jgi:hypothetical protein
MHCNNALQVEVCCFDAGPLSFEGITDGDSSVPKYLAKHFERALVGKRSALAPGMSTELWSSVCSTLRLVGLALARPTESDMGLAYVTKENYSIVHKFFGDDVRTFATTVRRACRFPHHLHFLTPPNHVGDCCSFEQAAAARMAQNLRSEEEVPFPVLFLPRQVGDVSGTQPHLVQEVSQMVFLEPWSNQLSFLAPVAPPIFAVCQIHARRHAVPFLSIFRRVDFSRLIGPEA